MNASSPLVEFREINPGNVLDILRLSDTLRPPQSNFVAPNAVSLAQAYSEPANWPRGIYCGDTPVGFLMLNAQPIEHRYFLWRLMIAAPHQRKGYGRAAVERLVEHVRSRPGAAELKVSCGQGEGSPEGFYRRMGFEPTGEKVGSEIVLRMPLEISFTPEATPEARAALSRMLGEVRGASLLYTAARINLADHLAGGPLEVEELARLTKSQPDPLRRFLRVLARRGLLFQCDDTRFALTALGVCLREGDESDLKGRTLLEGEMHVPAWFDLVHTLQTGETAVHHALGEDFFEYCKTRPALSAAFNRAMVRGTRDIAPKMVSAYDFTPFKTLVDIGGGVGALLSALLEAVPGARGILFDRPEVVSQAAAYLEKRNVSDRCATVGGSFFESAPPGGDAYILKWILHDWDDPACRLILGQIRKAMADHAVLLVVDWVVPQDPRDTRASESDLNMMVLTTGRERTETEFRTLFGQTGFELTRIVPIAGGRMMMEVRPV